MRLNFKKVSAIAASALMAGLTMGTAAAVYPSPFVGSGSSDVVIVYGTQAGFTDGSPLDMTNAVPVINTDLAVKAGSSTGSTTATGGTFWQVATGSDKLELGESIKDVDTFIGSEELGLLATETISNEKGEAKYEQNFYFEDVTSSMVNYYEDDEDNIGLFFKVANGQVIARYVMDFSTYLKTDIETDGELSDIEDKSITFLGKKYTVVDAVNGSKGAELVLMSGALNGIAKNGEQLTVGNYKIDVTVSSTTAAAFTVTTASGVETTDKMNKGDMQKLADGNYISVTDITYEGFDGGIAQATFYIGADKLEWKNGTSMTVNGETISKAKVTITSTEASKDLSISEIAINMTAEDDLYVPVNGKLSKAVGLDEPQVLVGQNWDIEFKGLAAEDYEEISLKVTESDQQYLLNYENYDGVKVTLPLVYANASGLYGGHKTTERFILDPNNHTGVGNITKGDYFLLHTADPISATSNDKTLMVQYEGADDVGTTSPKMTFKVDGISKETTIEATGFATWKLAGATFYFQNASSAESDDYDIYLLTDDDYGDGTATAGLKGNGTVSNYIRTRYNTLINITDTNSSMIAQEGVAVESGNIQPWASAWLINVSSDDGSRDGDDFTVAEQVFSATITNTSATPYDLASTFAGTSLWITDPSDTTVTKYINRYGADIVKTSPSSSPSEVVAKVPQNIVQPLVYISTGDLVVTTTTGSSSSLGNILVKDSEVSSVSSKNLIVVGGSCVNSVAAKLVGAASCGADFTTKTGIGSGQFLIQSYLNPYTSGKVALLVAGYDAVDTKNAATYLTTKEIDTTVGKKYKGTSATTAELVVA